VGPESLPEASVAAVDLVGRESASQAVRDALSNDPFAGALVLGGVAGLGKTVLWEAGLAHAAALGQRVVSARPGEAETGLSNAALGDLLGPLLDELRALLPGPQGDALDVALLRVEPAEAVVEARAVAAATLTALRLAARQRPVLLAIDDAQWLDDASESALRFAFRRLQNEQVRVFATVRHEGGTPGGEFLGMPGERVRRLALGPLDEEALRQIIVRELGHALPVPAMARLVSAAGGNPFYARELARAAARQGALEGGELPLPADLAALLRDRLGLLPAGTRKALATVATLGQPTIAAVAAAVDEADLDPAFAAGVLREEHAVVRFDHPLLAAAAYNGLPPARRRAVHRRLADLSGDAEERARHLAAAATRPDASVAAAIEEGAAAAAARGAPAAAAELYEAAARQEPDPERAVPRRLAAAERHEAAGNGRRATALLSELIESLPPGPLRARALVSREDFDGPLEEALDSVRQAVAEAGEDGQTRARAMFVGGVLLTIANRYGEALEWFQAASALLDSVPDPALRIRVLGELADNEVWTGRKGGLDRLRDAAALEGDGRAPAAWGPTAMLGRALVYVDDLAAARVVLEEGHQRTVGGADEESRAILCLILTELECRAGRLGAAREYAEEGLAVYEASWGDRGQRSLSYARLLTAAHEGDVDLARELGAQGLAPCREQGDELFELHHLCALGFLELSLGDPAAASQWLEGVPDRVEASGIRDPGFFLCHAESSEALIGLGRLDEAEARLAALEAWGRSLDRPRALATAARGQALVAAARGDLDGALAHLDDALVQHERLPVPLERARTLLVLGAVQRRAKRKAAARSALEESLAIAGQIGARLWVERARAELQRVGGRSRSQGLTPTESRVAALVAEGRTNREVADALFVTVRTVEANLTRVYAKLGVRNRSELASRHETSQQNAAAD
jgi:DNA-binding CsgD family transcriptional regulator